MNLVTKILNDIATGIDNRTFCWARIVGIAGVIAYIGMAVANFIFSHKFDYTGFGIGFASIMGGVGGSIRLKQDTEPQ